MNATQELFELFTPPDEDDLDMYEYNEIDHVGKTNELLTAGADINARDTEGNTFIIKILKNEYIDNDKIEKIIKLLLERGADPNVSRMVVSNRGFDENIDLPIVLAIRIDNAKLVDLLVSYNADVNKMTIDAYTPFQLAVTMDSISPKLIEKMINKGANVNHKNVNGEDALHILVKTGSIKKPRTQSIIAVLLEHGANPDSELLREYLTEHKMTEKFNNILEKIRKKMKKSNWRRISSLEMLKEGTTGYPKFFDLPYTSHELAQYIKPKYRGGKRKTHRKNINKNKKTHRKYK